MEKNVLVFLFLVLLAPGAIAQRYDITWHSIDIKIDAKGFAMVTERFFLQFPNDFQLSLFREESEKNGVSLFAWKSFDDRIHTYIGEEKELDNAQVGFVENSEKYLEITYGLKNPITHATAETTRRTEFRLKENFFRQFLLGELFIIPDNAVIRLELPSQAEIQGKVKPEAKVEGSIITMQGYKSSNVLEVRYRVWKQIASFDLQQAMQGFLTSELMLLLAAVAFALAILAYAKRREISQRIENYIVEHSEIKPKE